MGELQPSFFDEAADAIAGSIPYAKRQIIEGQSHQIDPVIFSQVLNNFFEEK